MQIDSIKVGWLRTNCYFLTNGEDLVIIDPGDEYEKIKDKINGNKLRAVFVTHCHPDHIGALNQLLACYGVPVNPKKVESFHYETILTPGHTEDSISFYFQENKTMFTGDFLFYHTIGRTDFPGGDSQAMKNSLEVIKNYDDSITVYPGHGINTILGDEKLRFSSYCDLL